jgi:hypothetical protein
VFARVIASQAAVPGREERRRRLEGLDEPRYAALDDAGVGRLIHLGHFVT